MRSIYIQYTSHKQIIKSRGSFSEHYFYFKDKQFSTGSVGVCLREVSLYKDPRVPISLWFFTPEALNVQLPTWKQCSKYFYIVGQVTK